MALPALQPLPIRFRRCRAADLPALEWGDLYRSHRALIEAAYLKQLTGDNEMLLAS